MISQNRLMEIFSVTPPNEATSEEWLAIYRLARIGEWYEQILSLKFMDDNLPKPQDALLGSRLRVQISMPPSMGGKWVDYRRDGKYDDAANA